MDTRTSQRTGGWYAGTIRRALRDTTLPGGLRASAGDYVVLDIIAASHDTSAFGGDADEFNPYRGRNKGVKSTVLRSAAACTRVLRWA
jgi:cytochrome P450